MTFHFFKDENSFNKKKNSIDFSPILSKVNDSILIANSIKSGGDWLHPFLPGYTTIPILTKSTNKWGLIGPYELKINTNVIFENYWQFSKVYKCSPTVTINQYGNIIWQYPFTQFLTNSEPNDNYWKWRKTGFSHKIAVRYPVYKRNSSKCLFAIPENDKTKKLDYISSRKEIYIKEYLNCLSNNKLFNELQSLFDSGTNLIISEVDGFHSHNAQYYKDKYPDLLNEPLEFGIINSSINNMKIKINESIDPAGHAYPIVMKLKNLTLTDLE